MLKKIIFLSVLTVVISSCSGRSTPDIIKTKGGLYGSSVGEFLIRFPNRPGVGVIESNIGNQEIDAYSFTYSQGIEHLYRVNYVDYPQDILKAWNIEELFDQIVKSSIVDMGSFSVRSREVQSTEFDKSIVYKIRSTENGIGIIRAIQNGKRTYILSFFATRKVPNNEEFDAFVNSFRIYNPK